MNKLINNTFEETEPSQYQTIYGYFSFQEIYKHICHKFPNGRGVEVGTWLGKSACYMAELIKGNGYNLKFYGVDTFLGEINAVDQQDIVKKEGGSIYKKFLENMRDAKVLDFVTPLQMTSEFASALFEDESLDFVFIDSSHEYNDVLFDLTIWYPKIKKSGIIAGHDYLPFQPNTVAEAVATFFKGKEVYQVNDCFLHNKI